MKNHPRPLVIVFLGIAVIALTIAILAIAQGGCGGSQGDAAEPKSGSALADACFHALYGEGAKPIAVCGPDEQTCNELRNAYLTRQAAVDAVLPIYAATQCR